MGWFSNKKEIARPIVGLVLPGGGARNAYQAGVLKAIAEFLPKGSPNPFPVISGTSSGAINAVMLATNARHFHKGVHTLVGTWQNFHAGKIFKTDAVTAICNASRWIATIATGGLVTFGLTSVLDNAPLRHMLERHVRLARIQHAIRSGDLRAVSITISGYTSGKSQCFFEGVSEILPWERTRRVGIPCEINIDHLMASVAIPLLFPAIRIGPEYFGDGSMRETSPLSPALHMGADRLLVIGIRDEDPNVVPTDGNAIPYPSLAHISGYVLDTLFMDSLDADIERLSRINQTVSNLCEQPENAVKSTLKVVQHLVISPSQDVREIAERHVNEFPRAIRILLRSMGALNREGRPLVSYLLFESGFTNELIELGYQDAMHQQSPIMQLLGHEQSEQSATEPYA